MRGARALYDCNSDEPRTPRDIKEVYVGLFGISAPRCLRLVFRARAPAISAWKMYIVLRLRIIILSIWHMIARRGSTHFIRIRESARRQNRVYTE